MKKIILILPYFGQFPDYFNLWLVSMKRNSTVDFLFITDNTGIFDYSLSNNIRVELSSLSELRSKIENKINCSIKLKQPYKLCDFKPAYGEIFSDQIQSYDFWGYLDADVILGDIRHFLTDEILSSYERIFSRGHFTLFKNNKKMNTCFRLQHQYKDCFNFSDVINYNSICAYDEWGWKYGYGLSEILKRKNFKTFDKILFADISPESFEFSLVGREVETVDFFEYLNGKILGIYNGQVVNEYIYIHLQKRKMGGCNIENPNNYYIYPNRFSNMKMRYEEYYNCEKDFYKIKKKSKWKSRMSKLSIDHLSLRLMMLRRKKGLRL